MFIIQRRRPLFTLSHGMSQLFQLVRTTCDMKIEPPASSGKGALYLGFKMYTHFQIYLHSIEIIRMALVLLPMISFT